MTQYARPDADTSVGNWAASSGSSRYAMIDESSTDDSDYISVENYGSVDTITVGLSDVDTPDSGTRTVVVRAALVGGMMGGGQITLTVTLEEGSTSKGSQETSLSSSATNLSFNITSSISDYSNLSLKIEAIDVMSAGTTAKVYQAYFSVPDAASEDAATSEAFLLFVD
jgi:hypothetical protein